MGEVCVSHPPKATQGGGGKGDRLQRKMLGLSAPLFCGLSAFSCASLEAPNGALS
jgi:hypothetical protein